MAPQYMTLIETNHGDHVELAVGDRLDISLAGNPTTGYEWALAAVDEIILKPQGEPEYHLEQTLPGSGGRFIFHFEALAPGITTLEIVYRRAFLSGQAADRFSLTVQVR